MKDIALEKALGGVSPLVYDDRYRPARCPSCSAPMWPGCRLAWQNVVRDTLSDRHAYVVTCASHYCRSRAHEFARFE